MSLETATRGGSLALAQGATVRASLAGDAGESHSVSLLDQIAALLDGEGIKLAEIDLFAAATGPGSFTGLRIGLATCKALAQTLKRPCAGVQTLHAVAHAAGASELTCALLPAGRGEVFAQLLRVSTDGLITELSEPEHVAPLRLLERLRKEPRVRWAGPGIEQLRVEVLAQAASLGYDSLDEETAGSAAAGDGPPTESGGLWVLARGTLVLAESLARLAHTEWRVGRLVEPADLHALYVRPSDAELNK